MEDDGPGLFIPEIENEEREIIDVDALEQIVPKAENAEPEVIDVDAIPDWVNLQRMKLRVLSAEAFRKIREKYAENIANVARESMPNQPLQRKLEDIGRNASSGDKRYFLDRCDNEWIKTLRKAKAAFEAEYSVLERMYKQIERDDYATDFRERILRKAGSRVTKIKTALIIHQNIVKDLKEHFDEL